jgi:hypothetical protein
VVECLPSPEFKQQYKKKKKPTKQTKKTEATSNEIF